MSIADFKDSVVRNLAKSFLFKYIDGYKTTIFRVVQFVNMALVCLFLLCPYIPDYHGLVACNVVDEINGKWLALSIFFGHIGLQFGIEDAKIKAKKGL